MEKPELTLSDDTLQRLSKGDEDAFRLIYDRYLKVVYHTAFRYLHREELAQDIAQEVFYTLWSKRERFTQVRSLESYLISMTHHQVYAQFRKWATESRSCQIYAEEIDWVTRDTDHIIRTQQSEAIIQELVDKLPAQQKLVYKMSRNEGMTHEAIARELNLSQGTVKNHLVRALQFLRQNLSHHIGMLIGLILGYQS
ncbi:MAG: RNA polymerase sigma-70 factor [Spirosomataceae bacterium]